jgi:hypothetical protein
MTGCTLPEYMTTELARYLELGFGQEYFDHNFRFNVAHLCEINEDAFKLRDTVSSVHLCYFFMFALLYRRLTVRIYRCILNFICSFYCCYDDQLYYNGLFLSMSICYVIDCVWKENETIKKLFLMKQ